MYKGKEEISGTLESCYCTHHCTFRAKYCLYISEGWCCFHVHLKR